MKRPHDSEKKRPAPLLTHGLFCSVILCEGVDKTEKFNLTDPRRRQAVAVAGLHREGQQHPPEREQ